MDTSFWSACILLFLVIDPVGNIPLTQALLSSVESARKSRVIVRESAIAFCVLAFFLLIGRPVLDLLQLSESSIGIAGGVVLFLIALRMIFHRPEHIFGDVPDGEPLLVPVAVPLIAGPSSVATVMLLASREPHRLGAWIVALTLAMAASTAILLAGEALTRWLGKRVIMAFQRLTGLILTAIAVEMFLRGIRDYATSAGFLHR